MTNQTENKALYSELKRYEPLNGVWFFDDMLGQGASGVVFKLKDISLGSPRYSAGKLIRIDRAQLPESTHTELRNVVQEITIASQFTDCKNIVKYLDHFIFEREGHSGQDIIIQSELLTSLDSYCDVHPLSEYDVLRIGIDICSALEELEKIGVMHRDIKPSNIYVAEDGTYKLGDFSIAVYRDLSGDYHGMGGTLPYVAPEVYRKNPYDHRADIYSLGLLMYRYLNDDKMTFDADGSAGKMEDAFSMRMNGAVLAKPIHASAELAEVVLKCCAFRPEDRYKSAAELKNVLLGINQTKKTRDIQLTRRFKKMESIRVATLNNTFMPFERLDGTGEEYEGFDGDEGQLFETVCHDLIDEVKPPAAPEGTDPRHTQRIQRIVSSMVNWFCFTCVFSLMPLIIFLLCRGAFAPTYPWESKLVVELLYFGLSLAVISIRELVNPDMWNKGQTPYLIALFLMLFILILAAVFFGIMTISDMQLLSIGIEKNVLLWAAGLIGGVSFITATCIQVWKEW